MALDFLSGISLSDIKMPDMSAIGDKMQGTLQGIESWKGKIGAQNAQWLQRQKNIEKGIGIAGGVSSLLGGIAEGPEPLEAGTPGLNKILERNMKVNNIMDAGADLALESGNPVGMAIGAGIKIANFGENLAKDEYGRWKSKGAAFAANLNPITAAKTAISNVGALFGGQTQQQKIQQEVDRMDSLKRAQSITKNVDAGNQLRQSLPTYQPPQYGKGGLKFHRNLSKFSR